MDGQCGRFAFFACTGCASNRPAGRSSVAGRAARALWFPRPRAVEIREEPDRPPAAGEVCIRAVVSAISNGTEMLVYRGEVPEDLALDLPTLRGGFGFPIKYGYASVGRVEEVGP